jgi:DNA-binding NtrC family response regulator
MNEPADPTATSPLTTELPSAPASIRAVRVEVVAGPDAGASLRGAGERVVIGTHRTADLVLSDRTVSRFHLELAIDGDAVQLRDLGSRNGVLLEGIELEVARLRHPTIVTIGQTELRIDLLHETVPISLSPHEQLGGLLGASPAMRAVFHRLQQEDGRDGHVLLEGERGTGKDTAAAILHERGPRRDAPIDVIDCAGAALAVERELFGHGDRPGALERCHGGTIVLDEVGGLSRGAQRTLVRALESRTVRRAEGAAPVPADVRAIAMSRRNLRADVNADRFAPELFELLAARRIRMPALRERPEDIPLLVSHFLSVQGALASRAAAELLAAGVIDQLRGAAWPGNVRELRAYVESAVAAEGAPPDVAEGVPLVDSSLPLREARQRWIQHFERAYVAELLERTGGNVSAAATLAGVDRVYMHRMVTRAGLRGQLSRDRR